ncbi:HTH_48 domain-containing protein [Trichonephila clavipes]|nr:HTH_48 domain-containing protein [Trichonephila clavipes]
MATDKVHLRHHILYEFQQERNATKSCRNLLKAFDADTVSDRTRRRCFEEVQVGEFDLSDKLLSPRATSFSDDNGDCKKA